MREKALRVARLIKRVFPQIRLRIEMDNILHLGPKMFRIIGEIPLTIRLQLQIKLTEFEAYSAEGLAERYCDQLNDLCKDRKYAVARRRIRG